MHNDHHGKDFFFGAMIGSTLGALTALMFTTKKGHKIQHDLMDKYHEFEKVAKHYARGKSKKAKKAAKRAVIQFTKTMKSEVKRRKKTRRAKRRRR